MSNNTVSLYVTSDGMAKNPDYILEEVSPLPIEMWNKGDPVSGTNLEHTDNGLCLGRVSFGPDTSLQKAVTELLDKVFENYGDVWHSAWELFEEYPDVRITCVIIDKGPVPITILPKKLLERIQKNYSADLEIIAK